MKKQLVSAALLAVLSSGTAAEWVKADTVESYVLYVNSDTIRRAGDTVKMWNLVDLKTPRENSGGKSYLSSKQQNEYNCMEGQWRMLFFSWHSGGMGGGEVVYSDAVPKKWEPVPPESGVEVLWKLACAKR